MNMLNDAKLGASGGAGLAAGGIMAKRLINHFSPITFIFSSYLGRNTIFNGSNEIIYGSGIKFFKDVKWVNPFLTIILPCVIFLIIPFLLIVVPYVNKDSNWIWVPDCIKHAYYNSCGEKVNKEDVYYPSGGCEDEEKKLLEGEICYKYCENETYENVDRKDDCTLGTMCLSPKSKDKEIDVSDSCQYPRTCQVKGIVKKAVKKCEKEGTEKSISPIWWFVHFILSIITIVVIVYLFRLCKYLWYMKMSSINNHIPEFKNFISAFAFGDLLGLY